MVGSRFIQVSDRCLCLDDPCRAGACGRLESRTAHDTSNERRPGMTTTPGRARISSRVVRNLFILYASQVVTLILSLAPVAFLPKYLNAAGMGRFGFASAYAGIFGTLMVMGTASYIVREIAHDPKRLGEIV